MEMTATEMTIAVIGDAHFPWANWKHLDRALRIVKMLQPDVVVQMGDLYDFYSWSRFARTLSLMTPKEELVRGRADAEAFWASVSYFAPAARRVQLLGNHDDRMMKTVMSKAPELEAVMEALDFRSLWRFPGVETQTSSSDELEIGGALFMHGHRSKLGDHMLYNQQNTVVGHSHKGGVVTRRVRGATLWELNAGFVADTTALPMRYGAQSINDWTPGMGVIDPLGPRFIPF